MIYHKICEFCGREFITNKTYQKLCGQYSIKKCDFEGCETEYRVKCKANHGYHKYCDYHKVYWKKAKCKNCGIEFLGVTGAIYCNKEKTKICPTCGKEFTYICKILIPTYCCHECQLANVHKTYLPKHNEIMWGQYREKMLASQKRTKKSEDMVEYLAKLKQRIDFCNNKKDYSQFDFLAKLGINNAYDIAEKATLYIVTFNNKDYIKVGIMYSNKSKRLDMYPNKKEVFRFEGNTKSVVRVEAIIHTIFERVYQEDILTGMTEFHKLSDLEKIKKYIELYLYFKFSRSLKFTLRDEEPMWQTLEQVCYYRTNDMREYIVVPEGFVSDLASVPKFLWWLFPPQGKGTKEGAYATSCLLHDYLCERFHKGLNTRKYADEIFLEAMLSVGINKKLAKILYLAVRLFAKFKGYK